MGDLSEHFDRSEFACKCGCGLSTPDPLLIASLEMLRSHSGKPLKIISGLRCTARNLSIGGAPDSQHVVGNAADIVMARLAPHELYIMAAGVPAFFKGGIGLYPESGFVHVDIRDTGMARWGYLHGKYCTVQEAYSFSRKMEA